MHRKLLASTVLSLFLATGAWAQTDTETPPTPDTGTDVETDAGARVSASHAPEWSDEVKNVFFSDDSMTTMKSEEEMTSSWESLPDEDKEQVRTHCESMDTAAGGASTDMGASASGGASTSGTADSAGASTETDAGASATEDTAATSTETESTAGASTDTADTAAGASTETAAEGAEEISEASMMQICEFVSSQQ